jgi:hypothetical protein
LFGFGVTWVIRLFSHKSSSTVSKFMFKGLVKISRDGFRGVHRGKLTASLHNARVIHRKEIAETESDTTGRRRF